MIHNYNELEDPAVRKAYGNLTSTVGIANNVILFLFKFLAGTLARSVSITADAVNNLSDAGSSVISCSALSCQASRQMKSIPLVMRATNVLHQ